MAYVSLLTHEEETRLDFDRLSRFCSACDPALVEETLCRAMETLARDLDRAESGAQSGNAALCRAALSAVGRLARALGMTALSRCADDCRICLDRRDEAALAATIGRLMRLGETSLYALWTGEEAGP